jgi:hypothetical protein
MDGSKSVEIVFHAHEGYKRSDGSEFTPSLEISCKTAKSGKQSIGVSLVTGGVATELTTEHPIQFLGGRDITRTVSNEAWKPSPSCRDFFVSSCLLAKFDEGKPIKIAAYMLADKDRIAMGVGPRNAAYALLFMRQALKAQATYIAFRARDGVEDTISQFDLSGLKAEFDKHPECSVK